MVESSGLSHNAEVLLSMRGIRKAFPGVQALSDGSIELLAGDIHALVGENGAGKSTLIKILTGAQSADGGTIRLTGRSVSFSSPIAALRAGIATIYQEFTLVPALSVRENLFLGSSGSTLGWLDPAVERRKSQAVLARLGLDLDPDTRVSELTIAHQQLVEIARALLSDCQILVMDEPTAALTPREVEKLFGVLHELAGRGIGIVFVSHRLDEVFAIADRITVMRDGSTVVTKTTSEMNRHQLIEYMVGRPIDQEFPKVDVPKGEVRLQVSGLSGGRVREVSFSVRAGEVLGIAGLMGAGRTEIARLLFGADPKEGGTVHLDGRPLNITSPHDAIKAGICLLTEDRKAQGLVLMASAKDNFALPNLSRWSRAGIIDEGMERSRFASRVEKLRIRVSDPEQRADNLSGGNQQKLLVARWLETESQVVIFDEPTRGIDVGAKYDMYLLIGELAAQGRAIIVVSSELPEILGICDRILVMRQGKVSGEITGVGRATQEDVMAMAV
jgi:ribose transport system ATP-binding protein